MVSPSDLLGRRVGNVRIEALLGVGGMGAVYQGYDEVLERHVAVKSLRWIEEGGRERVLREARILSRLDHPGICRIYDFASDGPRDLLILELVDGESLAQRLVSGRLARDEWLDLGVGMAQALAVAHDAGVVHRDLKPSNVMVTSTGPKVLDFGIARLASEPGIAPGPGVVRPLQVGDDDDATAVLDAPTPATVGLTRTGTVLGTPAYMSPEQARGERVGAPSDVFSLGLILSEMATGTRVFRARDPIKEAREAGSPDLGEVPAELRDLLSAMLDPRPDERPSAAEVVTRLERLKDRPRRRRHIILGLLVSTVVVVLGALTAWSWSRYRAESHAFAGLPSPARLLVMPFDNASGEPAWEWVRFGLRSLVTEALPQGAVEVIGLDVTRALGEGDDPVRLAQRGGAHLVLQVVFDRTVDGVVLATRLTWPNGREMRREIRSSDAGSAARALSDLLAERLDPGAAVVEAHSGDPFVDRLYAMAVGDLVRGDDPEGAAVLLTRCLELDPGFHRARLQRASAALQVTEWEKAEADLDRVEEEIEPRESILGPWLFDLRAQLLNRRGELDEARAVILEALARIDEGRWPQSARPSLEVELAELALHADEPLEAERWLRRAEEAYRGPDARVERVGVLLRLGVVLERLQRYDEALEILAETEEMARELELPRRLGQVWNSRGGVLRRTGDVEGALAAFEKAEIIARDTDNLELAQALRTNRALVLVEEGRLDEGYDLLLASLAETEAIGQRHNVALVRFNLAYVALLLERPTEARRHLEVAADFYGEAWDVLYLEGWIELLEGRADVALGTLRRARSEAGDLWGEGEEAILEEARLAAG